MPRNRSLFTPERIAVLAVCVLAIAAILYFATRPAPTVHHIVTDTADTGATKADTAVTKPVAPDTVIVLKSDGAHKRPNRNRPARTRVTRQPRQPKARDYSRTPEAENNPTPS